MALFDRLITMGLTCQDVVGYTVVNTNSKPEACIMAGFGLVVDIVQTDMEKEMCSKYNAERDVVFLWRNNRNCVIRVIPTDPQSLLCQSTSDGMLITLTVSERYYLNIGQSVSFKQKACELACALAQKS